MGEKELQWAWNKKLIQGKEINTGFPIQIIHQGFWNINRPGPDFDNAIIRIQNIIWYGAVEIHYKSSEWWAHGHHENLNYNNVILHVVVHNDKPLMIQNELINTLVVDPMLVSWLHRTNTKSIHELVCKSNNIGFSSSTVRDYWLSRLERKQKEKGFEMQLAAFVLGEKNKIEQPLRFSRQRHTSKYLLALHKARELFSRNPLVMNQVDSLTKLYTLLLSSGLTSFEAKHLIINGFIPLLFEKHDLKILEAQSKTISADKNRIIHLFNRKGITIKNSLQSQGLMEIYRQLCSHRNCLECEVGKKMLIR